jgi:cytochrome c1
VASLPGLGGGRLGPDLTSVYSRLEGRKALAAWLATPPTDIMKPLFIRNPITKDENLALVAYLKQVAEEGAPEARSATMSFLLAGSFAAALILVLFDFLWRTRYRAVRRPLVEGAKR